MARTGRRNDYNWVNFSDSNAAVDLAEGTVGIGVTALLAVAANTLVRIRGAVMVQLNPAAVNERAVVELGICVVGAPAFTAGSGSVPTPITESAYPFIWRGQGLISSGQETAVVNEFLLDRVMVDSKAMRKLKIDEAIILVAEVAASVDQGGSFDWMYSLDVLTAT